MKRSISITLTAVMLLVALSIFSPRPTQVAAGDSASPVKDSDSSFFLEDAITETNQKHLDAIQPSPKVDNSLERANLIKRINYINDANRVGYVYLLSDMGNVIGSYVIKGKPSSLNSYLTQNEQIRCKNPNSTVDHECGVIQSPDLDGSYGDNPDGIFFFTTDNNYVEWSGKYVYSSQAMNINTPVTLTRDVK